MNTAPKQQLRERLISANEHLIGAAEHHAAIAEAIAALAPPSGEGADSYWIHASAWNEIVLDAPLGDDQYSKGYSEALNAVTRNLCALPKLVTTPQSAPVDGEFVLVPRKCTSQMMHAFLGANPGCAKFSEQYAAMLAVAPTPPPDSQESGGAALIAAERERQITVEGWTPEHDDEHDGDELAKAAACYATPFADRSLDYFKDSAPASWPWESKWWKPVPNDRVRELVKAGALIAAEIDRLQRASPPSSAAHPHG